MRYTISLIIASLALFIVGCSKESSNDLAGTWVGVYDYVGYTDNDEVVNCATRTTYILEEDYDATKQVKYYQEGEYIESLTVTQYGRYSRSSTTISLWYDDCDCASSSCSCNLEENQSESLYYTYSEEYVDDEPSEEELEDDDYDESEYPVYRILKLRLIDDDDPYTEWVTYREL